MNKKQCNTVETLKNCLHTQLKITPWIFTNLVYHPIIKNCEKLQVSLFLLRNFKNGLLICVYLKDLPLVPQSLFLFSLKPRFFLLLKGVGSSKPDLHQ